ncbi:hypothetical protein QN224_12865 [Sinorhizobium sp. 8-89]|uniref:hypothetical protein n=1 Tax=Sinorhizobium sp. 7-81 TaxID=3049087 RepID=UPI0024C3A3B6|nr:hypothetical protein [Sinorhizobium sp. 7-81]MDK1386300.1 hypothetical protein [Sinorhizobium sp. 7-81]
MPRPYTRHATPEAAAEARRASVRKSTEKNKEKYAEKRRASAKARYQANRETLLAKANEYARANREKNRERSRAHNHASYLKSTEVADKIIRMFELLPEEHREEYAHWLLHIAPNEHLVHRALRSSAVDYHWVGRYAGF